jgi:ATP-binding protein involved in chromosome partitioning
MSLKEKVEKSLRKVIDPETGLDVLRMELIRDLKIEENGRVSFTFRPSSPACPLAFKLGFDIQQAVKAVEGVKDLDMDVDSLSHASQIYFRVLDNQHCQRLSEYV